MGSLHKNVSHIALRAYVSTVLIPIVFCILKSIVTFRAVSRQRLGKHIPMATDTHAAVFPTRSMQRGYKENNPKTDWPNPCGGGVEYLHRDPASRMRRRKGKSPIWDSKIWPRVLGDSDPKMTALARASSTYKGQTRPLVREGAPQEQDRNCHTCN
jgi:hypothetical protein